MDNLKYQAYKGITNMIGSMQGTLKESKFLEKGILTPEEFVLAGEHLTHKCPTWR
jgi:ubiquitin-like-conjugating enzyme ATG3